MASYETALLKTECMNKNLFTCKKFCLPANKSPPRQFENYLVKVNQINYAGRNLLKKIKLSACQLKYKLITDK